MKEISVFDVIGPIMVGPSSSHTAGALRIAQIAGKLCQGGVRSVEFELFGSFARTYKGHGTDRALVAGILGFGADDIRIRDSFEYADRAGLRFSFSLNTEENDVHPNTVRIAMRSAGGTETVVTGKSVGGGSVVIVSVDGVEVDFTGEYNTIVIRQKDAPGVAAYITRCLAEHGINIAFMRLYRDGKGELAFTIIEADERIPGEVAARLREGANIYSVLPIEL